jgi:hypothetical protein
MSKKLNIMSLSIEPELHELLKEHSRKKNQSVSEFVRKWLMQYPFNNDGVIPAVIDIPEAITGPAKRTELEAFLKTKCGGIVNVLCA